MPYHAAFLTKLSLKVALTAVLHSKHCSLKITQLYMLAHTLNSFWADKQYFSLNMWTHSGKC